MKKKSIIFFLFIITLIVIATILISGCRNTILDMVYNNISEIRENVYGGICTKFTATFISGDRENNYIMNGISEELIQFGIITIYLKSEFDIDNEYNYIISIDTNKYAGTFERNPYDDSLVADIKIKVGSNANIICEINSENTNDVVALSNISNSWKITPKKALEIATNKFKNDLKKYIINNTLECEGYVKIMHNKSNLTDFVWYVSFCGSDKHLYSCVINIDSGKIMSFDK